MRAEDSDRRYDDILKKIARRRPFGSDRPGDTPPKPQERALDLLNAFDALADLARRDYQPIPCYGPRTVGGAAWSGVVLWYHGKGYHGYQRLHLLGVWAHYLEGELTVTLGLRPLPYRAPVYDPGVYRVAIQNNFRLYYDDRGQPPEGDDRILYQAPFELKKRLRHRQALHELLQKWRIEIEKG